MRLSSRVHSRFTLVAIAAASVFCCAARPAIAQRALGLDVSAWQGNISQTTWNNLHTVDNRQFVIIRSSRGGSTGYYDQSDAGNDNGLNTFSQRYDDPYYIQNINRATAAGIYAGTYHFTRPDVIASTLNSGGIANTGSDEADHFMQMAGAFMRPGYLVPVHDLEAGQSQHTANELAQFSVDFANRLYDVLGIRPGIYTNGSYAGTLQSASTSLRNQLAQPPSALPSVVSPDYPTLWSARWPNQSNPDAIDVQNTDPKDTFSAIYGPWDDYGTTNPWTFWQYASTAHLPSYSTTANLDVDVSHGDIEYLKNSLVPALWMNDKSGNWSTLANWNSGQAVIVPVTGPGQVSPVGTQTLPTPRLPGAAGGGPTSGQNDTVILERPNANITVTLSSGTQNIRKLYMRETLNITGGSLTINYDPYYYLITDPTNSYPNALHAGPISAQFSGAVTLSGSGALSVHTLQVDAGQTFTLAGGALTFNTINLMPSSTTPGKIAFTGDMTINPLDHGNPNQTLTATIQNGSGSGTSGSIDLGAATRTIVVGDGAAATDLLISVPISGSGGGLSKSGTGTMALTNANTFSGPLAVKQGLLVFSGSAGAAASASGYTVYGGGTLRLDNSATNNNNRIATAGVTLNGGTLGFIGNTTTETTGNFSAAIGASTVALSGSGTSTLAFGSFARSAGAAVDFTGADSTHRATFTSGVTAGNFINQGTFVNGIDYAVYNSGTVYVRAMTTGAGASDYATSVTSGRHVKLSASASGVASVSVNTLNLAGATVGLDLLDSNTLTLTNGGIIKSGGGASSITGTSASLSSSVEYVINTAGASDALTIGVSVSGGTGLTKTGAGSLTLSNSGNNYGGTTSIAQGTLILGASNVIPDASSIVVGTGATLNMNGFSETVGSVTMYDGTIGSAGTLTLNGASPTVTYSGVATGATISTTNLALGTSAGTATFNVGDGTSAMDLSVSSVIQDGTGAHGLTKSGAGTLQLTGNNNFTGALNVSAGALSVSAINSTATTAQPLGSSSAAITLGSATAAALQYTGGGAATLNRAITIGGAGGGTIRTTSGALTIGTGGISGGGNPVTFDTAGANITVGSGSVISGAGTTVTKTGANVLTLSASNTYTGNTFINEGELDYSAMGNLGTGNALVFGGGTLKTLAVVPETRNVTLNANGGTIDTNGFNSTFSGVFSGAGGLTTAGTGTLTLSNTNSYSGDTTVFGGVLEYSSSANLGSASNSIGIGAGTLRTLAAGTQARKVSLNASSSTIDTNGFNSTFSGVFSGSGGLTKAGSGTMTLSGTNTYTGNTAINAGVLEYSNTANLGWSANYIVFGGGTLRTLAAGTQARGVILNSGGGTIDTGGFNSTFSGPITGTAALTKTGSGVLTLASTYNSYSGNTIINGGILAYSVGGNLGSTSNSIVFGGGTLRTLAAGSQNRSVTLNAGGGTIDTNGFNLTFSGIFSGTGDLTKAGGGTLTLSNTNTYSGNTKINAGVVAYTVTANLGSTNNAIVFDGGTLRTLAAGTQVRNVTLNAGDGTIDTNGFNSTFSGVFSGTGDLTKIGSGTLTLSNDNTYTGTTTISSGTLQIGSGGASGSLASPSILNSSALTFSRNNDLTYAGVVSGAGTLTKLGAGTLTLIGANTYTGATTISAGTLEVGNGGTTGSLVNTGGIVDNSELSFNRSNAYSYGGAISGSGTVTKLGIGTLTLAGTNTYGGNTTINNGVLEYSSSVNLGSGSNSIVFGGGTLRTLAAGTQTRNITLNAGGGTLDTNGLDSTFSGNMSGAGGLTKISTGTLTLTGATNNFNGSVTINDGIVKVTGNNQLGTAGVITNMTVVTPGASGHGGTLQLSGNVGYNLPLTIGGGGLNGVSTTAPGSMGALDNASGDNTWSGAVTLAGNGSAGSDPLENQIGAQGGVLRVTGIVQNGVSVNASWAKTGDGDVVLGGAAANTYSGLTRLFGGRLILEKDGALGTAGSSSGTTGNTFQLSGSASTIAFRAPGVSSGFDYNTFEVINTHGTGAPGFGQVDNLGGNNTFAGHIAFDGPTVSGARQGTIGVTSGSLNVTGGLYARGNDGTPRNLTKLGSGTLILSGDGGAATGDSLVVPLESSTFNVNAGTVEMRGPTLSTANVPGVTTWNVASGASLVASTGRFSTNTVNVGAGGAFNLTGGSTDLSTIQVSIGASFGFTGGTLHAQSIQGDLVNQGGTLAPGSSPGSTAIIGSYTQQSGATLDIEIGGSTAPGTDFDFVSVTGNASLNGTLDVSLINSFTPTIGQQFTVLTAGSVTNNGLALGGSAAGLFNLLVGSSSVILQVALPGDFNHDNVVDAGDYVVWSKGFGTTYFESDYDVWRAHYGESIPSAAASSNDFAAGFAVPEPATVVLLVGGLLPLVWRRRPRLHA